MKALGASVLVSNEVKLDLFEAQVLEHGYNPQFVLRRPHLFDKR
jgi:hypothetical protein